MYCVMFYVTGLGVIYMEMLLLINRGFPTVCEICCVLPQLTYSYTFSLSGNFLLLLVRNNSILYRKQVFVMHIKLNQRRTELKKNVSQVLSQRLRDNTLSFCPDYYGSCLLSEVYQIGITSQYLALQLHLRNGLLLYLNILITF